MAQLAKSNGRTLVRWVGIAVGLPALFAVALLGKDAAIVFETINENALKRETAALERAIRHLGELHAAEILSQTLWDEAFEKVVITKDEDWISRNFGHHALSSEGTQHLVILDGRGRAIYSSDDEGPPARGSLAPLLAAAKQPIERARELYRTARASGDGFGERLPGAMTDGLYVNDLIRIDGEPAMITVSPFTPDTKESRTPRNPTLLLGVRMMSKPVLGKLEALTHIQHLALVQPIHTAATGEHTHAVRDANGNIVTHLTWSFTSPGHAILKAALPAIALSLGLILLMTTLGAVTMRRLTRRLAESEQAALYASRHDAATGLANRGWFMRVFSDALERKDTATTTRAVLLIDCDHFKAINDTMGHAAGDAVLIAIGERLRGLDEHLAIAARLGGDEFALLTHPLAPDTDPAAVVAAIEAALTRAVKFDERSIPVSVSIGAAVLSIPSDDGIDAWLNKADMALYRAKRNGRGCGRLYDPALDNGADALEPTPPATAASAPSDPPAPTPANVPAAA